MTNIVNIPSYQAASVQTPGVRMVMVYDGMRGDAGARGEAGPKGDTGDSFRERGTWSSGSSYAPLDVVSAQSSIAQGITNLFIQKSNAPEAVSTTQPKDDPGRWDEIGYTEFGNALGNLWEVEQTAHGFTEIGKPLTFDGASGRYINGDPAGASTAPFCVIRDIPSPNTLVLQSSGLLPNPSSSLLVEGGGWLEDTVYYARPNGFVATTPPPAGLAIPVFRYLDGDAVVFPFESATVVPPPAAAPAPATTHLKLDDVAQLFDDVTLSFPLTVGAAPVAWPASTESFTIYIDGNPQQPFADFVMVDDGGSAAILFTEAPQSFQNFWGVYAVA